MVSHGILFIMFLAGIITMTHILDANAQLPAGTNPTTNTEVGGPLVPKFTSTQSQYCKNGTCTTGITYANGTASGNDTVNIEIKSRYPIIMIIPSEQCLTAIKNHVKTDCPPLQNLTKYDTSNQNISGKFIVKNGLMDRTHPQLKNHWMYYSYSKNDIVCVYCTGNFLLNDLYKTITITPGSFEYIPQTFQSVQQTSYIHNATGWYVPIYSSVNEINSGLNVQLDRNVDGNCSNAIIKYSDFLLGDTIKYLESGCKTTAYNKTRTMIVPNTPFSFDNPYSTLHYKAIVDKIKINPPGDCIRHTCIQTDNKKW